jgi:diacylglycerol kinase family enzyme
LVVVGGDGTVSEAAGGMDGAGVPMLVLPSGTENVLAKYLGSTLDAERAWRVLQAGREVAFDVPMMNGRRFLLMGGVGFDAECVRRVAAGRGGHIGYWDYFWPIWRTFWECRYTEISVVADGDLIFEGSGLAYVGNIPRYAVGLKILRDAVPDDGLLDVCILACRGRMGVLRHAWNVWRQRHVGREGVIYRRARNLRISAGEPVPVQLDGDLAGGLPAEFVMTSARVRFLIE